MPESAEKNTAVKESGTPAGKASVSAADIADAVWGFVRKWGWAFLLLLSLVLVGYYTLLPSRGYFHSDTTDTLMWAVGSNESGTLFNPDFEYACLLPFSTSLIMTALIPITGVSMTTHVIGMFIFFLLFAGSMIWMLRKMKWTWGWTSAAVFTVLMICSGSEKLREIFWGHTIYYSLGVLFIFVGLGLLFTQMDLQAKCDSLGSPDDAAAKKKVWIKLIVCTVLIGVWFLLTCMNQIIAITIFALPVMAAVFCERWLDRDTAPISRKNGRALIVFLVMAAGMVLGYLLTNVLAKDIVAGYEGAYSNYSGMDKWLENLQSFPRAWLSLLGVAVNDGDKLLSVDSVKNLLLIITGILILVLPMAGLCCYQKIEDAKVRILLLTHGFMVMLVMMGYVLGKLSNANWRLSPIVAMSALTTIVFVRWAAGQVSMQRFFTLLMIPMMLVCSVTAINIAKMPPDNTADNHLYKLAEALEDRNLNYGYATFWNANGMTVVSDSKVKCRSVTINEDGYYTYYYQGCRSWYNDQPGQSQYFLLMSQYERDLLVNANTPLLDYVKQEFSVEGYTVWVFNENIF